MNTIYKFILPDSVSPILTDRIYRLEAEIRKFHGLVSFRKPTTWLNGDHGYEIEFVECIDQEDEQ